MTNKQEILDYLRQLKSELFTQGITKLGVFGSYAKNEAHEMSDLDIAYESSDLFLQKHPGWNACVYLDHALRDKLAQKFGLHVDLF